MDPRHHRFSSRRAPPPLDTTRPVSSSNAYSSRNSMPAQLHDDRPSSERRPRSRRPSFKRAMSIISEPGTRHAEDVPPSLGFSDSKPRKSWAHPRRSTARPLTQPADGPPPPRQYYRDPEARLRLKEALGSPAKFEEALAYGFPTSSTRDSSLQATPRHSMARTRAGSSNNDAPRFLRSDIISWYDNGQGDDDGPDHTGDSDDDGRGKALRHSTVPTSDLSENDLGEFDIDDYLDDPAERSSVEVNSPVTPHMHDFAPLVRPRSARRTPHPLPSASLPSSPRQPARGSADWAQRHSSYDHPAAYSTPASPKSPQWAGTRDMTLRMTLTRPELRASDESIYGAVRAHNDTPRPLLRGGTDPWDLPPLDELAEIDEERKAQQGKGKSLWKKMSLGGAKK